MPKLRVDHVKQPRQRQRQRQRQQQRQKQQQQQRQQQRHVEDGDGSGEKGKGKAMAHAFAAMFLEPIKVTFVFSTGARVTANVKAWDTIGNVKAQVYVTGSDIIFAGQQLADDRTLSDCNIRSGAILEVRRGRRSRTPPATLAGIHGPTGRRQPIRFSGSRPWYMSDHPGVFDDEVEN